MIESHIYLETKKIPVIFFFIFFYNMVAGLIDCLGLGVRREIKPKSTGGWVKTIEDEDDMALSNLYKGIKSAQELCLARLSSQDQHRNTITCSASLDLYIN